MMRNPQFARGTLIARSVSRADAVALGAFFETLAADPLTARFFHPHPLTADFARALCSGVGQRRDRYHVVAYRGRVAGYHMLRGWDEGYAVPSFGGCVHPALRGAGLGHMLLWHAVTEANSTGAPRLRLTVSKANQIAVALYRKWGFSFTEKNEEEWVGALDLPAAPPTIWSPVTTAVLEAWVRAGEGYAPRAAC